MHTYDVKEERDGWFRVTRNGRIIRAYLPFDHPGDTTRYNLFMFERHARAAARKMAALAKTGFDIFCHHPTRRFLAGPPK